jgi:hypothetical protein
MSPMPRQVDNHDRTRRTSAASGSSAPACHSLAMQIVGHKTEAIYRRYAIVNDADLRGAADKLAALSESRTGTVTGTVRRIQGRSGVEAIAK